MAVMISRYSPVFFSSTDGGENGGRVLVDNTLFLFKLKANWLCLALLTVCGKELVT